MPTSIQIRRLVASLASVAVGVVFCDCLLDGHGPPSERLFTDSVIAVPFLAGALIWSRRLGPQLLSRGAWWSMLLLGGLLALTADHDDRRIGAFMTIANAIALLAVGSTGLDDKTGRFAPVAFRGTLLVALVLAIADTGAFTWFGVGSGLFEGRFRILLLVPPMATGVIGLLRLRTWGLIVSLSMNLLVVILALTGVLVLPPEIRGLFVSTAVLQMVVPIPMIVSIVRGRPPQDRWPRAKLAAPIVIITAISIVSAYAAWIHHGPLVRL